MKRQNYRLAAISAMLGAVLLAFGAVRAEEGGENSPQDAAADNADAATGAAEYVPTPENLKAREWFQDAKFGIFIHWGVYSELGRGEWVMQIEKIPIDQYEKLPSQFNPVKYDPQQWASLFKQSGAQYVTITSKHHDGFCMWNSKVTDWDIVDRTPYQRDVLKPLAEACGEQGLKLFFYHSHLDWHHPDYFPRGVTGRYAGRPDSGDWDKYLDYMNAQLAELLSGDYGQVAGIWFDGWWDQQTKRFEGRQDAGPLETIVDWRLRQTYDLIHSLQPAALVGNNHHVAPFPGEDFQMFERDLPGENTAGHSPDATIGALPLETCDTINGSWGYNASDRNYKSVRQLIHYLVQSAGRDANFLLNIGPRPDGTIDPEMEQRLKGIGEWLSQHGHTIYGTRGGPIGPQPWGTSTQTAEAVYLHLLTPPTADADGWITLEGTQSLPSTEVRIVPSSEPVKSQRGDAGLLEVKVEQESDTIDLILELDKH